jgi:hypothetical protein
MPAKSSPRPARKQPRLKPSAAVTADIDPADPLVPVLELAQESYGRRIARTSIWRIMTGRSGPRLPGVLCGNRWMTTRRCWFAWLKHRTELRLQRQGVPLDCTDEELADALN